MITVKDLVKVIDDKTILDGISFEICQGECVALIGPNGAGKTSLLSCLIGDKKATKGKVLIDGREPKASKATIAILGQDNVIPEKLRVIELIAFFQCIYVDHLRLDEVRTLLGFTTEQEKQLSEQLSGGQRRLLAFVLCLIGKPRVLILDEPTAGMDTSTRQRFWQIIDRLKQDGVTIVYSSHYIEEVEHTAERILVLHQGQLWRDTTPLAMRQEAMEKQITVPRRFESLIKGVDLVTDMVYQQDRIYFKTYHIDEVWSQLEANGCSISEIEVQSQSLLC
ncbi:ABC transporter ATP-binding protein [Streptococcus fryi]